MEPGRYDVYPDPRRQARAGAAEALRSLSEALLTHDCDDDALGEVAAWATAAAARARAAPPNPGRPDYQHRRYLDPPPPDGVVVATFGERPFSGHAHPGGVAMTVRRVGDEAVASVVFDHRFEASPGRVHGGMTAALFDDVMGYVNVIAGIAAVTASIEVRYVAAMPLATPVEFRARITERAGRRFVVTAEATTVADGVLLAEASGTFAVLTRERLGLA